MRLVTNSAKPDNLRYDIYLARAGMASVAVDRRRCSRGGRWRGAHATRWRRWTGCAGCWGWRARPAMLRCRARRGCLAGYHLCPFHCGRGGADASGVCRQRHQLRRQRMRTWARRNVRPARTIFQRLHRNLHLLHPRRCLPPTYGVPSRRRNWPAHPPAPRRAVGLLHRRRPGSASR